jgi:presenilin 1
MYKKLAGGDDDSGGHGKDTLVEKKCFEGHELGVTSTAEYIDDSYNQFSPSSFTSVIFPVFITMTLSALSVSILANQQDSIAIGEGFKQTYVKPAVGEGTGENGDYTFLQTVTFAVLFIGVMTAMTFLIVLVLYFKCYRVMFAYLLFAYSATLGFTGFLFVNSLFGDVFGIPIDLVSLIFIMYNFAIGGCLAIFWRGNLIKPIKKVFTDFYLVAISILMAYIFSQLSQIGGEVIIWSILVALACYDLCAVLSPCGPLRLLLKVVSNDKDGKAGDQLSGLLFEAGDGNIPLIDVNIKNNNQEQQLKDATREKDTSASTVASTQTTVPIINNNNAANHSDNGSKIPSRKPRPIRLGLGDFIFYSVLVSTAGHFGGYTAAFVCILTILIGLGSTLMLLIVAKKALPALPIPILCCVIFYSLVRFSTLDYLSDIMGQGYVL